MDLNDTLFWLVGLSTAVLVMRLLVQRPWAWGWCAVALILTGTLLSGWYWYPQSVGIVAVAVWLVLVVLPTSGQRLAMRLVSWRRTGWARWVARVSVWLHPADGWGASRDFIEALAALQEGRVAEGQRLLAELQHPHSPLGRTAIALQARQTEQWLPFLSWIDSSPDRDELLADGNLLDVYLQALGETGQRTRMLHEFAHRMQGRVTPTAQLRVAALCGEVATVERLLNGELRDWPPEVREYWRASVRQVQGDPAASTAFERLTANPNALIARLAHQRLANPLSPPVAGEFDAVGLTALVALRSEVAHEAQYAVLSSTPRRRPVVTLLIALALGINFAREIPGGCEDQENLVELGAVVIPRVPLPENPLAPRFDEWWRPLTAAFLHFGWPHFLMNLFALLFLGTRLERAWGHWRTLICYAAAIAVSMTLTPWILEREAAEPQILAGASGGIMGLLGGLVGHLLVGRWRRRTPQVAKQLTLLVGFVLLQTMFDFSHPEVSYHAHLLGLATGVFCGLLFGLLPARGAAQSATTAPEESVAAGL